MEIWLEKFGESQWQPLPSLLFSKKKKKKKVIKYTLNLGLFLFAFVLSRHVVLLYFTLLGGMFVVVLSRIAKRRDCQDICGTCQNICHVELANPLTKCTLLVIGQIQDVFNTSRNKSSSLVLKPCKSIQETSEKVLFIKP